MADIGQPEERSVRARSIKRWVTQAGLKRLESHKQNEIRYRANVIDLEC